MIDLTPLDVRNKRGDFKKILRGYDPQEVDVFLELVAERLEDLVRENIKLRERSETLQQQVSSQSGRERAVQEALVTAQELRSDIRSQAQREAELILSEARSQAREIQSEAERRVERQGEAVAELERRRMRFLRAFRQLLEREMDVVEVEEERAPLDERPIDIDLGGGKPVEEELAEGDEDDADQGLPVDTVDVSALMPDPASTDDETRPPLDAPVDELAAAHDAFRAIQEARSEEGEAEEPRSARELVLPLQDEQPGPGGDLPPS